MMIKKLFFILAFSTFSNAILGQSHILDPSFGNNGYTEVNPGLPAPVFTNAVTKTSDGNTIIAGFVDLGTIRHLTIAKVTETGYYTNFGEFGNGIAMPINLSYWATKSSNAYDVIIQPDAKIITVGFYGNQIIVIRLLSDGLIDETFGDLGFKTFTIGNSAEAKSVILQSNGKIVIGGYTQNGSVTQGVIIRLNSDGSYDTTFDTDGIVYINTGFNRDLINDLIIQTDGKIVACGKSYNGSNDDFLAVRLNTNGSFDTTFNTTGSIVVPIQSDTDSATCLTLQSDNKIVIGGYTYRYNPSALSYSDDFGIIRLNTNGSLDTSFSADGKYAIGYGGRTDQAFSIAMNGSSILIGGNTYYDAVQKNNYLVFQVNSSGTLDTSFGPSFNGICFYDTGYDDYGSCLQLNPIDIKLFGTSNNKSSFLKLNYFGNYLSNSSYDNSFMVKDYASGDMVKKNNNFFLSGGPRDNYFDTSITELSDAGAINAGFGTNGFATIQDDETTNLNNIAIDSNNQIYLTGKKSVYKFNSDGTLNNSFGINGKLNINIPYNPSSSTLFIDDIVAQTDNKFIVVSDFTYNGDLSFLLLRYNSDGSLDTSFDSDGQVNTSIGLDCFPTCSTIQDDGKILIGGVTYTSYSPYLQEIVVARYNSNGSLDLTFGTNGITKTTIGTQASLNSIKTQNDGKIIATGQSRSTQSDFTIVRYNTDGTPDITFGNNGIVTTSIGNTYCRSNNLAIQNDGKILVVGSSEDANRFSYLTIVRYNPNGSIDSTFANNGILTDTPDGFSDYYGTRIDLENDTKFTVLATNYNGYQYNTTLIRYILDPNLGNIDFASSNGTMYIYPNPIEEETNLVYKLTHETSISIELFDMQGKLLKTYLHNENQNPSDYSQKIVLPVGLQSGNYLLKISSPEGSNTIKLLKK